MDGPPRQPDDPGVDLELTIEEKRAQKAFFSNAVAGRRTVCTIFHLLVALGAVSAAMAAIVTFVKLLPWHPLTPPAP